MRRIFRSFLSTLKRMVLQVYLRGKSLFLLSYYRTLLKHEFRGEIGKICVYARPVFPRDGGARLFFRAIDLSDCSPIFIKLGVNDYAVEVETEVYQSLTHVRCNGILKPKLLRSLRKKHKRVSIIVFPYCSYTTCCKIYDYDGFRDACISAIDILEALHNAKILHGDIVANNVFLHDHRLLLFDFDDGYAKSLTKWIDYSRHGTNKRRIGSVYYMDDAFAFTQLLYKAASDKTWCECEEYRRVVGFVGRLVLVYDGTPPYFLEEYSIPEGARVIG